MGGGAVRGGAARLRRALGLAREGRLVASRREARAALAEGSTPGRAVAAASLFFVTRDYHEALGWLDGAFEGGAGASALWLKYQLALRLGWDQDAREALERGAAAQPGEPRWLAALLSLHGQRRDSAAAIRHGEALLARAPSLVGAQLEVASLLAAQGDLAGARRRASLAAAQQASDEARLEAARLLRGLGDLGAADALLASLAGGPRAAEARRLQAEAALWSGQLERAEALLGEGEDRGATLAIRCAIAAARGQRGEARRLAAEAVARDAGDHEAHLWLAELLTDEGQHEQAHRHQERAVACARGTLFAAHWLRIRTNLRAGALGTVDGKLGPTERDHLLPAATRLCPGLAPQLEAGEPGAWGEAIERFLEASHGNRSTTPTWRLEGPVEPVPTGVDPRAEARRALERVRVSKRDELLADLEALARLYPRSGLAHAHRGELLLWLGETAAARAALEQAIATARGTRWAYIGLTMCDILDGDPEKALATSAHGVFIMRNTEGPAVYVHRGEALRRLGRLAEAGVDLERSTSIHAGRAGAWVNLGLLRLAQGSLEGARAALEQVWRLAPGLVSDAARAEGVELFVDGGAMAPEAVRPALERSLALLRGNRSSGTISYITHDGRLRFGHQGGQAQAPLHEGDERLLTQAAYLLQREQG